MIPPPAAVGEIVAGCHVVGLEDDGDPVWAMCRAVILLRTWEYLLRRSQASQVQRHP